MHRTPASTASTTAAVHKAIAVCCLVVAATTAAARAADSEATLVVTQFYNWYLAQHGNVDWYAPQHGRINWDLALHHHTAKYFQAQRFFHPALFGGLDDNYAKSIGDTTPPFYVSTTPEHTTTKMSAFDPFVGAASAATSYRIGPSWTGSAAIEGTGPEFLRPVTLVPVTFAFAGTESTSRITVIVRKNGSAYQIYDIHYGPIPFYYAGRIDDLQRFLSAYNC